MQNNSEGIWMGLGSLIVVIFIMVALLVLAKRFKAGGFSSTRSNKYVKVLDKLMLGPSSSVLILQVGDRYFLVSVSSAAISILKELEAKDLVEISGLATGFGKSFTKGIKFKGIVTSDVKKVASEEIRDEKMIRLGV